jgi:transcriptional regulator with XRE-family HTH domain
MTNRYGGSHGTGGGDEGREAALHRFVRERRMRLAPKSQFLGERPRLSNRIGKPVTQEELAEHLGISRGWYARFEAGGPAGFSIPLLNRLCDILLLSAPERAELVRLAMPDLAPVVPRDSSSLYEALSVVRRAVKRLWHASSEDEIIRVAGEEARQLLPSFELIFARRITAFDEAQFPRPGRSPAARLAQARACALRRFTPEQLARVDALWQCAAGGGLVPIETYPPDCLRLYGLTLDEHGIAYSLPVAAHIRASSGSAIVGVASTHPHDVTELERAILSTIADFASLALH